MPEQLDSRLSRYRLWSLIGIRRKCRVEFRVPASVPTRSLGEPARRLCILCWEPNRRLCYLEEESVLGRQSPKRVEPAAGLYQSEAENREAERFLAGIAVYFRENCVAEHLEDEKSLKQRVELGEIGEKFPAVFPGEKEMEDGGIGAVMSGEVDSDRKPGKNASIPIFLERFHPAQCEEKSMTRWLSASLAAATSLALSASLAAPVSLVDCTRWRRENREKRAKKTEFHQFFDIFSDEIVEEYGGNEKKVEFRQEWAVFQDSVNSGWNSEEMESGVENSVEFQAGGCLEDPEFTEHFILGESVQNCFDWQSGTMREGEGVSGLSASLVAAHSLVVGSLRCSKYWKEISDWNPKGFSEGFRENKGLEVFPKESKGEMTNKLVEIHQRREAEIGSLVPLGGMTSSDSQPFTCCVPIPSVSRRTFPLQEPERTSSSTVRGQVCSEQCDHSEMPGSERVTCAGGSWTQGVKDICSRTPPTAVFLFRADTEGSRMDGTAAEHLAPTEPTKTRRRLLKGGGNGRNPETRDRDSENRMRVFEDQRTESDVIVREKGTSGRNSNSIVCCVPYLEDKRVNRTETGKKGSTETQEPERTSCSTVRGQACSEQCDHSETPGSERIVCSGSSWTKGGTDNSSETPPTAVFLSRPDTEGSRMGGTVAAHLAPTEQKETRRRLPKGGGEGKNIGKKGSEHQKKMFEDQRKETEQNQTETALTEHGLDCSEQCDQPEIPGGERVTCTGSSWTQGGKDICSRTPPTAVFLSRADADGSRADSTAASSGPVKLAESRSLRGGGPDKKETEKDSEEEFKEVKRQLEEDPFITLKTTPGDKPNSVVCRVLYPCEKPSTCFDKCNIMTVIGYGAEDRRHMTRHMNRDHKVDVVWMYMCTICGMETPKDKWKSATKWMTGHLLKNHQMKPETRFKMGKDSATKTRDRMSLQAPSFAISQKKKAPEKTEPIQTEPEKTPEKVSVLESKPQTRSVTKLLSSLKKSAQKDEKKEEGERGSKKAVFSCLSPLVEKEEPKKNARRSLAAFWGKAKTNSPQVKPDTTDPPAVDLSKLTGAERVKAAREQSMKTARRSIQRRESLAKPPVGAEPRKSLKPSKEAPEKEEVPVVEPPEQELNRTFDVVTIDDDDDHFLIKRKHNTWALDHVTTRDAYLDSDTVMRYLDFLTAPVKKEYGVLDPMSWVDWREFGSVHFLKRIEDGRTYFFPVCEQDHWILLVIKKDEFWYTNSLGYEPRGKVKTFLEFLGKERMYFEKPPPCQSDLVCCGIHVCLVAKSVVTKSYWYTQEEVGAFREEMKAELRKRKFELYSEPFFEFREEVPSVEPERTSVASTSESEKVPEVSEAEKEPEVSVLEPEMSPEVSEWEPETQMESESQTRLEETFGEDGRVDEEAVLPPIMKVRDPDNPELPKLMDLVIRTPPKVCPPKKKERLKAQKGRVSKVPNGKPEELVAKVREWFKREMNQYFVDGKSFQRLEWISDVLTAAIQKASVGDIRAVELIEKRCPPPEVCPGEMCTQTDTKKKKKKTPEARENEAAQKLVFPGSLRACYLENKARAFNKIIGKESKQCEIPIETLEEFFRGTTSETNVAPEVLREKSSKLPRVYIGNWMVKEFSEKEVTEALKKTKDTAPGVDGLRYHHLQWFDPDSTLLATLYNECREHKRIPGHWKEAETILLYKGGDETKPENWRPISLMPTIYKLYSSLWNRRIRSVKGVMSSCQRGFQEREGCSESISILRTAIDVAKGKKRDLSVAWLDLTNAFGSVPHELIGHTLETMGYPDEVVEIVRDMYKGAAIRVKNRFEKTEKIMIKSGVKQGDPISPTLFNMCLENVIRRHLDSAGGHKCINTRIKVLAFADDMAILSESKNQLQSELKKMDEDCTPLNLIFKPAKCASLVIERGRVKADAEVMLKGQPIRNLKEKDTYKYLGVQAGIETRCSGMELMEKVTKELDLVNRSEMAQHQKLDCVKSFVLPKLTYMYANAIPKLTELKVFSNLVMGAVKTMHNLPIRGSPCEYVQLPICKGGLGVPCPKNVALITFLVATMKKLWSTDKYIQKLYTDFLMEVVQSETGSQTATLEEQAAFLSNEVKVDKKAFGYSVFTRVREVCNSLTKIKGAPLHALKVVVREGKLAILVQATKESSEKVFTELHQKKLLQLLKQEVNVALLQRFTVEKPVKSMVSRVVLQHPPSNRFVRDGKNISFAAQKFVHKARLNLLPCNYNIYAADASHACRRCDHENETQWHILQTCRFGLPKLITERHDAVLQRVADLISKGKLKDWKMKIDTEISGVSRLRPDIYLESPDKKEVLVADVAIRYEMGIESMEEIWKHKKEKYEEGLKHLWNLGKSFTVHPIVVGSLGTWWSPTTESLVKLGIEKSTVKRVIPELCSTVLEYSKNTYYNHIFGKEFSRPPMLFGGEKKADCQWKRRRRDSSLTPGSEI